MAERARTAVEVDQAIDRHPDRQGHASERHAGLQIRPFKHYKRAELSVGALRAKAKAAGVDTTLRSTGGAAPLAAGEEPRPVTSGDVVAMYTKHAEAA